MSCLRVPILGLALLLIVAHSRCQSVLFEDSLVMPSLGRVEPFRVLAPAHHEEIVSLPGLVLLHGFGGNYKDWTELTHLQRIVDSVSVVIIMPYGDDSWYANSSSDSSARFEDYVANDLCTLLRVRYGVDTTRLGIAGLSMGGYGCLIVGLHHPHRFHFIGAMSASLDVPLGIPLLDECGRGGLRESLVQVFGEDSTRWEYYNPFHALASLDSSSVPYIYLVTGVQDEFALRLTYYRQFAAKLSLRGLPYEYHETPGRHNWDFWAKEIAGVVSRFSEVMEENR